MAISKIETDSLASGLVAPSATTATTATALTTASGSAPSYSARAWVNFDGTGTIAIRAAGNVSSITDNGTGDYTVNFAVAVSDANYSGVVSGSGPVNINHTPSFLGSPGSNDLSSHPNNSSFRFSFYYTANSGQRADPTMVNCAIFR